MYGYPRKKSVQPRYAAPNIQYFDPSGDPDCTGWWRGDSGLQFSAQNRSYVTGWTEKLPSGKALSNTGSAGNWVYLTNYTNGWGGVVPMGSSWGAAGIAQAGDRKCTYTFVGRMIKWVGDRMIPCGVDNMLVGAIYDAYLIPYHPQAGWWWTAYNWQWNVTTNEPFVFTSQMRPHDDMGNTNGVFRGAFNASIWSEFEQNTDWGDRVLSPSSKVYINTPSSTFIIHEIITWRRYLTDVEISVNHQQLMQQYGLS